jgi:hypothetical protein
MAYIGRDVAASVSCFVVTQGYMGYIESFGAPTDRSYAAILNWTPRITMSLPAGAVGCRLENEVASCKVSVFPEQEREGKH